MEENEESIHGKKDKKIQTFLETWFRKWKADSEKEPRKAEMNKIEKRGRYLLFASWG